MEGLCLHLWLVTRGAQTSMKPILLGKLMSVFARTDLS